MKWTSSVLILSSKSFGEKESIITCFSETHGMYRGLLRGTSKYRCLPQPGTLAQGTWSARLSQQLGTWSFEPIFQPFAYLLNDPLPLSALCSGCGLVEASTPERENPPHVYTLLKNFVHTSVKPEWAKAYVDFERALLSLMGFELKLDICAATGTQENLFYISPKSGRALSQKAGEPYKDKLFKFPRILNALPLSQQGLSEGLEVLGYFWEKFVLIPHGTRLPESRRRFLENLIKRAL